MHGQAGAGPERDDEIRDLLVGVRSMNARVPVSLAARLRTFADGCGARDRSRPPGRSRPIDPPTFARIATIVLTSVTALALTGLALVLGDPHTEADAPVAAAQESLVRQFYTAIDGVLNGGDPRVLDSLVAQDIVVHSGGRQLTGMPALEEFAASIAAASPGQHLTTTGLVVEGDRAAAAVEREGSMRPAPDIVIDGPPDRQDGTERFRLVDNRIAEYWSLLDDRTAARVVPGVSMPLRSGMKQTALVRFALPPGATLDDVTLPGPHVLLPETGVVTVMVDGRAQVARADALDAGWSLAAPNQEIALGPGDALLIPAGGRHTIRNDTAAGATMLGLLVFTLSDIAGVPNLPPLTNLYASAPYGRPTQQDAVTATLLARGFDGCAACPTAAMRVIWLPLASGQSVAPQQVAGMAFLAVEAGAVLTREPDPASLSTGSGSDGASASPAEVGVPEPRVIAAGEAIAQSGRSARVVAAANAAASLVLIDVDPGAGP